MEPPIIPPDIAPTMKKNNSSPIENPKKKRVLMTRPGLARKGQPIPLLTNHFKVSFQNMDDYFFHYNVNIKYEDDRPVLGKAISRKVIDKMQQIYNTELGKKVFAYDGENTLFTIGPLSQNNIEFTIILHDITSKRSSRIESPGGNGSPSERDIKLARPFYQEKAIKVEIKYATKFPMQSIAMALNGQETESTGEAFRVLNIILRQHAAKQGCLLVRQSFFHDNQRNYTDLGGGVMGCRGFHASFHPVQGGLSLNIDVSTTMILRPGPVIDFLIANQNVRDPFQIDWAKAKRMLKNLRIKKGNMEYKIVGLSELPCNQQTFTLKRRGHCGDNAREITVYEYFVNILHLKLKYSVDLPCINVGKPKRPTYIPIELCDLVSLQRYTKSLTIQQRVALVEKSSQKPQEKMHSITNALKHSMYDTDPMLQLFGVSINTNFTRVEGRVLQPPKLIVGNGEHFIPRNGRWNLNNKKFITPAKVETWAAVNFSARCDTNGLVKELIRCGSMKGIIFERPLNVFEENPSMRRAPASARVKNMFDQMKTKLMEVPKFLLCLMSEKKNSIIYGPWKRKCLVEFGIVTQCMAPTRVNDQYLGNLLLKINAKLGGMNSLLQLENTIAFPIISKVATIIFGMDVSHGSPGRSDIPSIAAVVSSRQWPLISKYRASVRTQTPKVEMIDSLFKLVTDDKGPYDEGIIREGLLDFYKSSGKRRPDQIIIFRDGVSESQFNQVLNDELEQIIEACKFIDENWFPKFTLIIAQKNHHTRFFLADGSPNNVPPGTVVDTLVCHPTKYDFYMYPHAGMIGTSRPTHYHVLLDENNFNPNDMQELVHSLSYVCQRSTTAISIVAPIYYAHLAASQSSQFLKIDETFEASFSQEVKEPDAIRMAKLPALHEKVKDSMFFC